MPEDSVDFHDKYFIFLNLLQLSSSIEKRGLVYHEQILIILAILYTP